MSFAKLKKQQNNLQKNIHSINMQMLVIQEQIETTHNLSELSSHIEENLESEFSKLEELCITIKESLNRIEMLLKRSKSNSSQTVHDIHAYYSSINQESHW